MAFMVVDNMPEAKLSDDSSQDHTYTGQLFLIINVSILY